MRRTIFFIYLSSSLAIYNPYEDATSPYYETLFNEFRSFIRAVLIANINRREKVRFQEITTSCTERCGEKRSHSPTLYCHCDENCRLTQDCCCDYLKTCKPNTTINQVERAKWRCISTLHRQHVSFLPWYDTHVNLPRIKGHMMISSCLNCSRDLQEKCSDSNHSITARKIPVEGPDGQTYRNRFCALGNGIKPENITNWGYELVCSKIAGYNDTAKVQWAANNCFKNESGNCPSRDKAFLYNNCTWYFALPPNATKTHTGCSPVKICPPTPQIKITTAKYTELKLKCKAYMRVVYHNGSYYKNFHCALCYGVQPTELENQPTQYYYPSILIFFETPKNKPKPYKEVNVRYGPNITAVPGNNSQGSSEAMRLEVYFNLIGLSISMVTLLFLLALYSLAEELRTTPGKIIIGLSISTLVYQSLLLASPQFSKNAMLCSLVAIFLHFATLLSFSWMSVMSFDVWKTFGKNNQRRVKKKSSSFLYYCLFVFISPSLIVLTAITLDKTGVTLVYWRNGESSSCWILTHFSSLVFFKVPVAVSLGLNIIAFIWTIFGITKVRRKSMKYDSTRNKQAIQKNMKMYGKLSVVMGFTWILGFSMEYSVVLQFIYLIVNSLQGFFIFLAFVTNKRVVEKWKMSRPSLTQSRGSNTRNISYGSST